MRLAAAPPSASAIGQQLIGARPSRYRRHQDARPWAPRHRVDAALVSDEKPLSMVKLRAALGGIVRARRDRLRLHLTFCRRHAKHRGVTEIEQANHRQNRRAFPRHIEWHDCRIGLIIRPAALERHGARGVALRLRPYDISML